VYSYPFNKVWTARHVSTSLLASMKELLASMKELLASMKELLLFVSGELFFPSVDPEQAASRTTPKK